MNALLKLAPFLALGWMSPRNAAAQCTDWKGNTHQLSMMPDSTVFNTQGPDEKYLQSLLPNGKSVDQHRRFYRITTTPTKQLVYQRVDEYILNSNPSDPPNKRTKITYINGSNTNPKGNSGDFYETRFVFDNTGTGESTTQEVPVEIITTGESSLNMDLASAYPVYGFKPNENTGDCYVNTHTFNVNPAYLRQLAMGNLPTTPDNLTVTRKVEAVCEP